MNHQKKIIIGVSGASGIPIAISILKTIKAHPDYRSLMVLTDGALQTLSYETEYTPEEFFAHPKTQRAQDFLNSIKEH